MSQITTHVLDTSTGKPAEGIKIKLYFLNNDSWDLIAEGVTNKDGRMSDLIKAGKVTSTGVYKMNFDTGSYFSERNIKKFYPFVEIVFETDSSEHYHIPLLLNPFGYSTYRGS